MSDAFNNTAQVDYSIYVGGHPNTSELEIDVYSPQIEIVYDVSIPVAESTIESHNPTRETKVIQPNAIELDVQTYNLVEIYEINVDTFNIHFEAQEPTREAKKIEVDTIDLKVKILDPAEQTYTKVLVIYDVIRGGKAELIELNAEAIAPKVFTKSNIKPNPIELEINCGADIMNDYTLYPNTAEAIIKAYEPSSVIYPFESKINIDTLPPTIEFTKNPTIKPNPAIINTKGISPKILRGKPILPETIELEINMLEPIINPTTIVEPPSIDLSIEMFNTHSVGSSVFVLVSPASATIKPNKPDFKYGWSIEHELTKASINAIEPEVFVEYEIKPDTIELLVDVKKPSANKNILIGVPLIELEIETLNHGITNTTTIIEVDEIPELVILADAKQETIYTISAPTIEIEITMLEPTLFVESTMTIPVAEATIDLDIPDIGSVLVIRGPPIELELEVHTPIVQVHRQYLLDLYDGDKWIKGEVKLYDGENWADVGHDYYKDDYIPIHWVEEVYDENDVLIGYRFIQ